MKKWLVLFGIIFLTACGNQTFNTETTVQRQFTETSTNSVEMEYAEDSATDSNEGQAAQDNRYLIYNAHVNLQTIDYEDSKEKLFAAIEENGAYVQYQDERSGTYYYGDDGRGLFSLSLTLRVPQDQFEATLANLTDGTIGELMQTSRGTEDVTRSMTDLDIRLESIEARIERLNELLDEATIVSDIITIQESVEQAILERDQLLSEQAYLQDQVNDATITVELREVTTLDDGVTSSQSFWDQIVEAFAETGRRSIIVFQEAILSLIFLIPYLIILLILLALYYLILRPIIRSLRRRRKENSINDEKTITVEKENTTVVTEKELDDNSNESINSLQNDEKDVN